MDVLIQSTPFLGIFGLLVAYGIHVAIERQPAGTDVMREIAGQIRVGAMAFLRREYTVLVFFVVLVALLLGIFLRIEMAYAFVGGALCSVSAGYFGMRAATSANVRTAEAARTSGQRRALLTAFHGGAVMGVSVASLGLIGLGVFFHLFGRPGTANIINGFAMGASSIALFARVGGGIYTKAADVGADLVGKVEAGIPEDDPRNPGVIADNVGDNVGDVAGMGADIFESYVGAIIATVAIGATLLPAGLGMLKATDAVEAESIRTILMSLPLVLAGLGLVASFLGIASMKILKGLSPASALRYSTFIAAGVFLVFSLWVIRTHDVNNNVFWAVFFGTIGGILIGLITEYYTSGSPVRRICASSKTGPATNIISGLSIGFESSALPVVAICLVIFVSNSVAGLYGIGIAAVGMLASATVTGVLLALMMANAGGAWDNAKKAIEKGEVAGEKKGTDAHKAAVVGDTVGDPFKDTSAPAMNILIKLMSIVSLVIAPLLI